MRAPGDAGERRPGYRQYRYVLWRTWSAAPVLGWIVNLFALLAHTPNALQEQADRVDPNNDAAICAFARQINLVICGWGTHGALLDRGRQVRGMLGTLGTSPRCLALNRDGSPRHPHYVGLDVQPVAWLQT